MGDIGEHSRRRLPVPHLPSQVLFGIGKDSNPPPTCGESDLVYAKFTGRNHALANRNSRRMQMDVGALKIATQRGHLFIISTFRKE